MSTAVRVPETSARAQDALGAEDAASVLRRIGPRRLVKDSYQRFRYSDGFSNSRALGYQFVLSFIPLMIAFVGLSSLVHADRVAETLRRTLVALSPGAASDAVDQALRSGRESGAALALVGGLVTALVSMAMSMALVERGTNRIYGIQRDRPVRSRYARAAVLALVAGVPSMIGFLVLVAGGAAIDAAGAVYGIPEAATTVASVLRVPVGAGLDLIAITALFRWSPRRRQPGPTWLVIGAGTALALWLLLTGALALYVHVSGSFGHVYGPLTGIVALLLWANLTSVALLLGVAVAAQLEAVHAGVVHPVADDPEQRVQRDGNRVVLVASRETTRGR